MRHPLALVVALALGTVSIGALSIDNESDLRQRVQQGDAQAGVDLAAYYLDLGQKQKAMVELVKAADRSSPAAHRLLADLSLRDGDYKTADQHFRAADRLGDPGAKVASGTAHAKAAWNPALTPEARASHAQSAKRLLSGPARSGDVEAAWHLGLLFSKEGLVTYDPETSLALLNQASAAGHASAAYLRYHQIKTAPGAGAAAKSLAAEARAHLERAAAAGHPGAIRDLGGAPPALEVETLVIAAPAAEDAISARIGPAPRASGASLAPSSQRDSAGTPPATESALDRLQEQVADLTRERDALKQEVATLRAEIASLGAYQRAREHASELNARGLQRYASGDYEGALPLIRAAAEADHAGAVGALAIFYLHGKVVERNVVQAERLLIRAADLGNAVAAENLGDMYDRGIGVRRDQARARHWYGRAVALGSSAAQAAAHSVAATRR